MPVTQKHLVMNSYPTDCYINCTVLSQKRVNAQNFEHWISVNSMNIPFILKTLKLHTLHSPLKSQCSCFHQQIPSAASWHRPHCTSEAEGRKLSHWELSTSGVFCLFTLYFQPSLLNIIMGLKIDTNTPVSKNWKEKLRLDFCLWKALWWLWQTSKFYCAKHLQLRSQKIFIHRQLKTWVSNSSQEQCTVYQTKKTPYGRTKTCYRWRKERICSRIQ